MYAVIRTGGKQYRVNPGEMIKVEKLAGEVGEDIVFDDVLMVGGEGDPTLGTPVLGDAEVLGKIVAQDRAKKLIVYKMKKRKRYRVKQGHRQYYTGVAITSIKLGDQVFTIEEAKSAPVEEPVEEKAPVEATEPTVDEEEE